MPDIDPLHEVCTVPSPQQGAHLAARLASAEAGAGAGADGWGAWGRGAGCGSWGSCTEVSDPVTRMHQHNQGGRESWTPINCLQPYDALITGHSCASAVTRCRCISQVYYSQCVVFLRSVAYTSHHGREF